MYEPSRCDSPLLIRACSRAGRSRRRCARRSSRCCARSPATRRPGRGSGRRRRGRCCRRAGWIWTRSARPRRPSMATWPGGCGPWRSEPMPDWPTLRARIERLERPHGRPHVQGLEQAGAEAGDTGLQDAAGHASRHPHDARTKPRPPTFRSPFLPVGWYGQSFSRSGLLQWSEVRSKNRPQSRTWNRLRCTARSERGPSSSSWPRSTRRRGPMGPPRMAARPPCRPG